MADTIAQNVSSSKLHAIWANFLGTSPHWYKYTIIVFLIVNPILFQVHPFTAGWMLVLEFIFTLAMALKCYPLQPGGLLALEAFVCGMASADTIYSEIQAGLPVILLLIFMVAGIFFMKELLLFTFTKILLNIKSQTLLSLLFCVVAAFLSAFLDALTVTAVIITVASGFYTVYHEVAVGNKDYDGEVPELPHDDLETFRAFLRGLLMHAAVGTALGGVLTTVGEPQNLLISEQTGWEFIEFFIRMLPVTLPVFVVGLATCVILDKSKLLGYGVPIPDNVRTILANFNQSESENHTTRDNARLVVQAIAALFLVIALGLEFAQVGIVGLAIIVIQTAFNGIVHEHHLGDAFKEALPFTALLTVFFAIVAVIHEHHLFSPIITYVLSIDPTYQVGLFFIANGLLSAISDNVFVATVYITEVKNAWLSGMISREQFELLAIAINTGTNIPSILTPNGQAAFLFLLTSSVAPLIRLSYGRMVLMALPYFVTMSLAGWIAVQWILQ